MSIQNPQLAGFLLTGNRSNFLLIGGSTACLYDYPHFLSRIYQADRCFDRNHYILKIILCMLTQLQDKRMTMLPLLHVIIILAKNRKLC